MRVNQISSREIWRQKKGGEKKMAKRLEMGDIEGGPMMSAWTTIIIPGRHSLCLAFSFSSFMIYFAHHTIDDGKHAIIVQEGERLSRKRGRGRSPWLTLMTHCD